MKDGGLGSSVSDAVRVECDEALLFLVTTDGLHHEGLQDTDEQVTLVETSAGWGGRDRVRGSLGCELTGGRVAVVDRHDEGG